MKHNYYSIKLYDVNSKVYLGFNCTLVLKEIQFMTNKHNENTIGIKSLEYIFNCLETTRIVF